MPSSKPAAARARGAEKKSSDKKPAVRKPRTRKTATKAKTRPTEPLAVQSVQQPRSVATPRSPLTGAKALDEQLIAQRAYGLWLAEGRPHGRDYDHWMRARQELSVQARAASA